MSNVKAIRPSLLETAVFFIGGFPGKVTVAVTGGEAAGEPSIKVTDAYWKKMYFCYFKEMTWFKKMPANKKKLFL